MRHFWVLAALAALVCGCGEDDRPARNYIPGVYQGAADQPLTDEARKELAARVKTMGRF